MILCLTTFIKGCPFYPKVENNLTLKYSIKRFFKNWVILKKKLFPLVKKAKCHLQKAFVVCRDNIVMGPQILSSHTQDGIEYNQPHLHSRPAGWQQQMTFTEKAQQKILGRWLLSCVFDITPGTPDFPGGNVTLDTTCPQSYLWRKKKFYQASTPHPTWTNKNIN